MVGSRVALRPRQAPALRWAPPTGGKPIRPGQRKALRFLAIFYSGGLGPMCHWVAAFVDVMVGEVNFRVGQ
jgi:hypothetical protein